MNSRSNKRKNRDFSNSTIQKLRERVAYMCSNPLCRRLTVKRAATGEGVVRQGKAAHIYAAGEGPRFDPYMTDEVCRSFENAIWLCDICSREIDDNKTQYLPDLLKEWKSDAEKYVEELVTHDSRLRQLRGMIFHVLSTLRILSALPANFDQTFEPHNGIGLTRQLIEAEQILFENSFEKEAYLLRIIRVQLENDIYPLIRALFPYECLDISIWKNKTIMILMFDVMRFRKKSYIYYMSEEEVMVKTRKTEILAKNGTIYHSHKIYLLATQNLMAYQKRQNKEQCRIEL